MTGGRTLSLPILPQSPGLSERIWWGSGTRATARWTAEQGMNLMSSTLLTEDTGVPFDELQAEQIAIFRQAWKNAGWRHTPRVSVSRSVLPIVNDYDEALFGHEPPLHRSGRQDARTRKTAGHASARPTLANPMLSRSSWPVTPPSVKPTPC